ncbi:MAG: hypothetical protein QME94_10545 [Anaerolineae bacterium]|nr:hypothetical protein [Anaerolineae bacterium]
MLRRLLLLALLAAGCEREPVPVAQEHAPFRLLFGIRYPVHQELAPGVTPWPPWALPLVYHLPADGRPCPGDRHEALDAETFPPLDPWCVVYPLDWPWVREVPAGTIQFSDAKGHTRTFEPTRPGSVYWYLTMSFCCQAELPFDLAGDLILEADGDEQSGVPAFGLKIPGAPMPEGDVELGGSPSQTSGLPFTWRSAPGTVLWLGLLDGAHGSSRTATHVLCEYQAGSAPERVSGQVIRWLAARGVKSVFVSRYLQKFWSATQGADQFLVDRSQEYPAVELPIVP